MRVGAIGLGLMGSALTASLLERGFEVLGFDLDPQRLREHEQRGGREPARAEARRVGHAVRWCRPPSPARR
jgi:3-hydroxyisobutyrate dehydrogenase-like beta-hydroxyacid dehydrogenase